MARRFPGGPLLLASHNPGKLREIRDLLAPLSVEVISAAELGLPQPEETGTTFAANARAKALAGAEASGRVALGDDSGLVVAALGGAPGIQSARWAGVEGDFAAAMARLERELAAKGAATSDERRAAFVAALCLAWPEGHCEAFEGRVDGTLVWPFRGHRGFGYDPMFQPQGHDLTFGEMEPEQKHAISHRARALAKLVRACFGA